MNKEKSNSKQKRKILITIAIIFILTFCVRITNLELIKDNPFFNFPTMDEKYHDEWAQEIAAGNLFQNVPFYRAPAYPYFLGLIYAVFGHGYYLPRLIGIIIGSLSCVLIYLIGKEIFSHKIGLLASLLASFYSMFLYYDSMLLTANLEIVFCLLSVLWLAKWLKNKSAINIFVSGIFLGLASITRPNFLIFIPIIVIFILAVFKNVPIKTRLNYIFLLIIGIMPIILPVVLINVLVGKDFVLLAWNGGINFYLGNNPFATGWSATSPELDATWWGGYKDAIVIAEEALGHNNLPVSQVSNYWFTRGLSYIFSQPLDWLLLMLKKLYLFLNAFELSNNQIIQGFQEFSILLRIPILNYGTILTLAIWGIISSIGKRNINATLMFFLILSYAISVIMFFVCSRYRVVITPFLLIFAAYAIIRIIQQFKEKRHKQILFAGISMIVMIIFFSSDVYGMHIIDKSEIHVNLGNRFFESRNYTKAVKEYSKALTYNSKNTDAMNALGNTYMMVGQINYAVRLFKTSLTINRNVDALCKLGFINMQANNMDSAKIYFDEAVTLDSTNPEVYYYTGIFYAYNKQPQLAIKYLEMALQYYPDPKYLNNLYTNLGKLYLEVGNKDDATKYLLKAGMKYDDILKLQKNQY